MSNSNLSRFKFLQNVQIGCWLDMEHEKGASGEKERTKMSERLAPSPPSPFLPFIGEVGGEVFIIPSVGLVFYTRASRATDGALNLILQAHNLCN
jgi:hypothetical protein